MNTTLMKDFFISNGFSKESGADFFRENNGFLNCINLQKKTTGDIFFINLGVHPIFAQINSQSLPKREIDCYIRTRLSTDEMLSIELLNSPNGVSLVIKELEEKTWAFFDFFSSIDDVFSHLSIDNIKDGNIPAEFDSVTSVRLISMCMNYNFLRGNIDVARDFARYGLSIAGMAVGVKKTLSRF
ncbi:DUF4304 domain-containing protein [Pectobacterium polonicum]|uniref:DUF4304 domain-containing protein n=1 Tax=Pectobacterium polonicum TaxID=2485124 RepID=UPI0010F4F855|nr:DUF4304 domain-containing protein [Pectobacterium polonicum]TKY81317.1 DUF4304 domain-containing protein [Pectobacterium polonicum]